MSRGAIQLNPEKVRLLIDRSGIPIKRLLEGMNAKTVHRIKAGKNTTFATAHKLATKLGTTVEDLMAPVTTIEMGAFLPDQWLYDEAPGAAGATSHRPFWTIVGGGAIGYLIGPPPIGFSNPIEQLRKWLDQRGKKIVLRQENGTFTFQICYFDYSPDRQQDVEFYASTACRFFPLIRQGDVFSKATLGDLLHRYVWNTLHQEALDHAEIVEIEGHQYPAHPRAYFPLARFYQGSILKRIPLGARVFKQLHDDFKWSLVDYIDALQPRRVRARATCTGIALTLDAVRPATYKLGWEEDKLEIEVDLVWKTPEGRLAFAPWRKTHRTELADAISQRAWSDFSVGGMPFADFSDSEEEPVLPPFAPDLALPAETIVAINALRYPDAMGTWGGDITPGGTITDMTVHAEWG